MQMVETAGKEVKSEQRKRQYCTFWLSGHLFGIDIADVKEINSDSFFTPIFHAPKEVKGYVNIRGQIHLILGLRALLGFENGASNKHNRLVLLKSCVAGAFGVLVDKIGDVVTVNDGDMEKEADSEKHIPDNVINKELIVGVCKLENNLLVILNARELLDAVERVNKE